MLIQRASRTVPSTHHKIAMALQPSADAVSLSSYIDQFGTPMSFSGNTEIYGEDESADYLYKVVSGAVRTCRVLADGRRQLQAWLNATVPQKEAK